MSSPSRLRREGRNAFYRGGNPADRNPYVGTGPFAQIKATEWLEGWAEARIDDERALKEELARQEQADLEEFDKLQEFARLYNLAKEQGLIS
jgi:hypothetical protein